MKYRDYLKNLSSKNKQAINHYYGGIDKILKENPFMAHKLRYKTDRKINPYVRRKLNS